jgi:endoglucanase
MAGVNWFGMETATFAPHGLWARNYRDMLDQIKGLGFNVVRVPFANEMFDLGKQPSGIDFNRNPDLQDLSPIEIMDRVVSYAGKIGLRILLDRHRPDSSGQSQLWYTSSCTEDRWIADWKMLAARYKGDATVIGFDLHNEPRNPACWGCGEVSLDWRLAAQRAGNAVLDVNPNLLIVVEGVELHKNQSYWWGGNLKGVGEAPVLLRVANRVVYSAHDYPSSLYPQPWFSNVDYPANLADIWDWNWGYIARTELAPVLRGEFGSKLQTKSDEQWFSTLINYLDKNDTHWLFWSWNANSDDTGGLLLNDWSTVDDRKIQKLRTILKLAADRDANTPESAPQPETTSIPESPKPVADPSFCKASFRVFSDWESGYIADLHVTNEGVGPIEGWTVSWEMSPTHTVRDTWNARFTQTDRKVTVQDAGWNAKLPEKSTAYFGLIVDYSGTFSEITNVSLNGFPCTASSK